MNKSYKSVWNETTGTYVAASETAKSRGKSSRSQKALVAALLAAGVGFGTAVKSEAAATPNSYAAGVLGTDSSNSDCISSADGAQVSTGADCTSGSAAQEAGIVSYDANGNAGAYFTVTDPNTAHVGVGGVDQLLVTNNGLFVLNALDMGSNKITNLAAGTAATDAANFGQVTATAQSIAAALGGGASVDASGRVTTPTYTIGGLSYSDVGSALGGLDARMTSDETAIDNLAVSGSKYIAVGTGGNSASATGAGSLAIGPNAKAPGNNAQAFGSNSYVSGQNSIGMGYNSTVSAAQSTALGYASNVGSSAAGSTALGWYATSTAASGVAVGGGAAATAANSVALGASSLANRANTVSVGTAGATRQIVNVGAATQATDAVNYAQLQAAGLKTDSSGNATNSFVAYDDTTEGKVTLGGSAGTTLTNVAAGAVTSSSTDAINGSQLYATNQDVAQSAAAIAQNTSDIAQNTADISDLDTRVTTVEGSVNDLANQLNSGTVGLVQQDQTTGALTVASTTGGASVDFTGTAGARELLGVAAGTTSTSAVNLGQLSPVVASLGGGAQVNADGSITSPTYHMQGGTQTTVGGALDTLDTNLSSLETAINNGSIGMVTQDPTSRDLLVGATTDGLRVNMAGTTGNRVVTGVAAGAVSAASIDAVNGSQLYANAASTAAALGGGSTVNADGTVSAPSYSVGGTTVNNVGAAITNIDGRVTQNTSDIASLQTAVGTMSGSVANAVSYDSSAHNQVTLGGSSGAPAVKLTNLQEGELSATSTDAVTGAQLWNTNQQLSDLTQSVQNQQQTGSSSISVNTGSQPAAAATGNNAVAVGGGAQASGDNSVAIGSGSVADVANTVSVGSQGNERRITNVANGTAPTDAVNLGQMQSAIGDTARAAYSGVAAATALTMIPEVDPGKTLAVGVAGGTYKGYQAAAVGASARITQNLKIKIGAGVSGSETTVGAGASYQW
ncbi:autotransporter adhesin [Paraburkholderia sp. EB58]|uniref:YadA-like family protein n=1 Tax=Paraburkholderia sp. EB58 TaxID=3035125 RepID=UPI003D2202C8